MRGLTLGIERRRGTLERLSVQLRPLALKREITERRQRLAQAGERMRAAKLRRLGDDGRRLAALTSTLEALSYHNVLKRGYAIIEDASGKLVRSADGLAPGDAVTLRLHDGDRAAAIAGGAAPPRQKKPPSKARPPKRRYDAPRFAFLADTAARAPHCVLHLTVTVRPPDLIMEIDTCVYF